MNRFFHRYRKAIVWFVVVGFALSIFGAGMMQRFSPAEPGTAEETILSVAGHDVSREQLAERYENIMEMYQMYGMDFSGTDGEFSIRQIVAEATEEAVREVLLEQEASRLGVSVPAEQIDEAFEREYQRYLEQVDGDEAVLEQYLSAQGMTLQGFKRDLRARVEQQLKTDRLRSTVVEPIEPSAEDLEDYYAEHRELYKEEDEELRLGHIQVQDVELAERLLQELRAEDADWSALAEEHSLYEETREAGGETDWFASGESGLPSSVEREAFDLDVGGIALVGEDGHQHIIKLLERQPAVYSPFEDVRDEVRERFVAEEEEDRWKDWYRDLRRAADVEIRDPLIEAFATYRQDREAGLELLEQAYADGEVTTANVQLYLGRMHEALKDDALGEVAALEELEELSPEEEAELEAARKAANSHREAALEYYLAFAETGEADEAVFKRILDMDPDQTVARYRLGEAYREEGAHVAAREQYERALELDPDFVAAYVGKGDVCMAEGLYGRATESYREALERDPESLSLKVKLAEAYFGDGAYDQARELLQTVLAEDERNVTAMTLLGDVLMDEGDFERALENYEQAYERNPTSEVRLKRAQALAEIGRDDDAKTAFRELVREFPYRPEGYVGLGDIYRAQGEEESAVEQYRLGLRQAPDLETQEAIARRIVELRPDDVDMRFRLAGFLSEQGESTAAMEQYEQILNIDPDSIHAFLGLGGAYVDKGEYDKALEYYEQALAVAQTRAEELAVYDRIVAADEQKVGPEEPLTGVGLEALWQRALLRYEEGDLQGARSDLQRIHDTDPEFRADELEPLLSEVGGEVRDPQEEREGPDLEEVDPEAPEEE
ncbi:MAG: tetratricopeptide repeat protein [Candidatus Bipolaricaulota bacterium]